MLVDTDSSGRFRVWTQVESDEEIYYSIALSRTYKTDDTIYASAFSSDGSVLAIMNKDEISLWETGQYTLQKTISFQALKDKVPTFGFLHNTAYLVAHVENKFGSYIYLFDIFRSTELWDYHFASESKLSLKSIHLDPHNPIFIAICHPKNDNSTFFFCFSAHSSVPVSHSILPEQIVTSLVFHNNFKKNKDVTNFVCFTSTFEFLTSVPSYAKLRKKKEVSDNPILTKNRQKEESDGTLSMGGTRHSFLEDTPSHVIPPLHSIYTNFMNQILMKTISTQSQNTTNYFTREETKIVETKNETTFSKSVPKPLDEKRDREVSTIGDTESFISFFSKLDLN